MTSVILVLLAGPGWGQPALLDPMTRDERISSTAVRIQITLLTNNLYEYVYTVSTHGNAGVLETFQLDVGCELEFADFSFEEPPAAGFVDHSDGKHVPLRAYLPARPLGTSINSRREVQFKLNLRVVEAVSFRVLSPAPPGLRNYRLAPAWPTDRHDYARLTPEQRAAAPSLGDFVVTGQIEGPGCARPPASPKTQLPPEHRSWVLDFAGLGPIKVGATYQELVSALGSDPRRSSDDWHSGGDCASYWFGKQTPEGESLFRILTTDDVVQRIDVESPLLNTTFGVKVGDDENLVYSAFPSLTVTIQRDYVGTKVLVLALGDGRFIGFDANDGGGKIEGIRYGRREEVTAKEGCL